jgi:ribosomal protein S18 acetylase RimI-like enzyme
MFSAIEPDPMPHIALLDHSDQAVAQTIHALLVQAHAQEAELLELGTSLPLEQTAEDIQASTDYFLGAELDGALMATVSVGLDDEPGQILVKSLVVHRGYQRQGMARALLMAALRLGGGAPFSVVTAAANAPALSLYHGFGFVEYRRGTLGTGLLAMVKLRRAGLVAVIK